MEALPEAGRSTRWMVIHEIGAPSHYTALKHALGQRGLALEFVEFNFYAQTKAIIKCKPGQWRKTLGNLQCFARFIFNGARGLRVILGIGPFNPWLVVVRWTLRHAEVSLHSSWPYWDGSKQPHAPWLAAVLDTWQRFVGTEVKAVLIATELAKANLSASRYAGAPVTVVAHSFDSRHFYAGASPVVAPRRMLYIGRLEVSKGIDLMIEIARRRPQYEMVFVGWGPLQQHVMSAAASLPNLSFLGEIRNRAELAEEIRASDVLLLPSIRVARWEELFGMVLIEAMACGAVPLATDHVGPSEILASCQPSLVMPEANFVDGVCERMDAWQQDPQAYQRIRQACLDLAAGYTVERISQRWAAALGMDDQQARPAESVAPHGIVTE